MINALFPQQRKFKLSMTFNKLVLLSCLLVIGYFWYVNKTEQAEASVLILSPKVNDIYFLDYGLFSDKLALKHKYKLALKNKYKLAKVVGVTGDNVALVYGRFFYQWQNAVVNSIEYGDLSNNDYFTLTPNYIPFSQIKEMQSSGAIYLVKRPIRNKLYGHFISP